MARLSKYGEIYRKRVGPNTVVVRAIFQQRKGDSYHVRVLKGAGRPSDERKRGHVLWRDDFHVDTYTRQQAINAGVAAAKRLVGNADNKSERAILRKALRG